MADRAPLLTAFVPRLALELSTHGVPSWTSVDGSMLSADISGFTALSERLAGKGKAGAEEITQLINTCFTALIDAAYAFGGEVVKFGGDALLIIFRGEGHERRAADAGLAMQAALRSSAAARRAQLSMTVGVAEGPFDAFVVGSKYRELLICGQRASEVIRLEAAAAKGDTLVSPGIAACLPPVMCGAESDGGVVVSGSSGDASTGPAERTGPDLALASFVPARVIDQLEAFAGVGGEHRLVTVGFVMVTGVAAALRDNDPTAVADALGHVVDEVVAACDDHRVTLLHSDIATDGVKFVLCAGAPLNTGDTADSMLQTALAIARIESPFVVRQGVQSGRVFAGFLGTEHRRTYTLMGDPVNTAARMLGKAGDREVVAVATVLDATRTVYVVDELPPFLVKGKSEPITAHTVRSVTDRVRRDGLSTALVGREREMAVLSRALRELGVVVEVVGSVGVGKSRLLDAVRDVSHEMMLFEGSCTPYGAATPYGVFRPLLRAAVGIPLDATAEEVGARLTDHVARHARALVPMLPLLAMPFGARVPSTPEVDAIDPEFRRLRLQEVVVAYLDAFLTGASLLMVEDLQWVDDASGDLVNHLVRACASRPWSIVVSRRPEGEWRALDAAHVSTIDLQPLDRRAVQQLAIEVSSRPLLDREIDLVVERSQGNPLFAIELARALADDAGELPDTVEQIIASRLDQLEPNTRRLVRVASVLGNEFDDDVVTAMMAADGSPIVASDVLGVAVSSGAVAFRAGTTWAFNHALYRDAAYEGLPFARRRQLHRLAATIIEERTADPASVAPLLSLHYSAARLHDRAWQFSLLAATTAVAQRATAEAADAYERALASGRHAVGVSVADRNQVAEALGDLYFELGRFDPADRVYQRVRRAVTDPVDGVRLLRKLGNVAERQGRPDLALRRFRAAAAEVPVGARDPRWAAARADVALAEAGVRATRNENEVCLELAGAAFANAAAAGDLRLVALALERMQLAIAYLDQPDVADIGGRALAAYRDLDDHNGTARILANLGIDAYFSGDWDTASRYYLEALELAQRGGNVVQAATAAINNAEILSDQGHWSRAVELCDGALRNYEAVGYSAGIAASLLFSGTAALRAGWFDDAAHRLERAHALLERLGMVDLHDEVEARVLELHARQGIATVEECLALAARFGRDHSCHVRVLRARALVEHRLGVEAEPTLREALAVGPSTGYERALTLHALRTVRPDAVEATEWQAEADATFRTLGVVAVPPFG